MLSALFASVADAVISYAIDKLDPAEALKSWLGREPATLAFQKSLARTYSAFARQYPDYTASLFDESFLKKEALPELSKLLTRDQHPDPALLTQAWGKSLGKDSKFSKRATKPASYFIERLEAELKAESALQALFDSRALESLPKLEAEIQKLTGELKRGLDSALKSANEYQVQIGGDVTNSNIIVGDNNTINQYFYSGDFVSLNEYYIPPDGVFQRVRVDEFVGRDWLTAQVDAFLNDTNRKSGAFLLIGDAGVGKTAFMAHLVKERRYLHLFAEQVPGQAMLQRAIQSLGSQLVTRYQIDPYKDRDTLIQGTVFPDFLERLLCLAASALTEGEKIVIVCDALDEAGTFPDGNVFGLPNMLPDGVYLILSQRPVNTKLPNIEPLNVKLEAQGADNLQDMEKYLGAVAQRAEVAGQLRAKEYSEAFFIQTLKEKSLGVWMYLHYVIKEIEHGSRAPLELDELPTGLVGYYAEYWNKWRIKNKRGEILVKWKNLYAPLLSTLAAAQDAVTVEQLTQWAKVKAKPDEVKSLLSESWRSFVTEKIVGKQKVYAPYHLSFRDFITGRVDLEKLDTQRANLVRDLSEQTVEAHQRIVKVFEAECNGQWEKLVEREYPRLHLSAHLNGAGEYETLRILLTEGDEKIKWAEAREQKEETYAGYLNDLTYVWAYAECEQNYALAIRCMLIENSIHSLAANIPPELLVDFAQAGLWSYDRCLSIIRQKSVPKDQAKSLELISFGLPPSLLPKALAIAHEIKNESERDRALAYLAPDIQKKLKTQDIQNVLTITGEVKDNDNLDDVIVPAPISSYKSRISSWQNLLATSKIEDGTSRAKALADISLYINGKFKTETLREALTAILNSRGEFGRNESKCVHALTFLAPYLNDDLKTQAFAVACKIVSESGRADAFTPLAPYLNDNLKVQAFIAACELRSEYNRTRALTSLVTYLNDDTKSQAFAAVRKIIRKDERAHALISLMPYFEGGLKVKALVQTLAAVSMEYKSMPEWVKALLGIAPHLKSEDKIQTLCSDEEYFRQDEIFTRKRFGNALEKFFVPRLTRMQEFINVFIKSILLNYILWVAVVLAFESEDDDDRISILSDLAPHLVGNTLKALVFVAAHEIKNECRRVVFLSYLVPHLNEKLKVRAIHDVLAAAHEIKDDDGICYALMLLIPHLSGEIKTQTIQKALAKAHEIKDESERADLLVFLVSHLNDEFKMQAIQEALATVREIKDEKCRFRTLTDLAPYFNEELKKQVFTIICEFKDEEYRFRTLLVDLALHLDGEIKTQVLTTVCEFDATNKITSLYALLEKMAPQLHNELKTQAINMMREFKISTWSTSILRAFVPYFSHELKAQIFDMTREIKEEQLRAFNLSVLVPYLNDEIKVKVLQEALIAAREIKDEFTHASVLAALAPHLNDELKTQMLADADEIKGENNRARVLTILAPYLNDKTQNIVLQKVLYISDNDSLSKVLNTWKETEFKGLRENIMPFIKFISLKNRNTGVEVVGILAPALVHFNGEEIVPELYRAIQDTARWWP